MACVLYPCPHCPLKKEVTLLVDLGFHLSPGACHQSNVANSLVLAPSRKMGRNACPGERGEVTYSALRVEPGVRRWHSLLGGSRCATVSYADGKPPLSVYKNILTPHV